MWALGLRALGWALRGIGFDVGGHWVGMAGEQLDKITGQQQQPDHPLYGALRHLGGSVASTEELDEARRELWAGWDYEEAYGPHRPKETVLG